MQLSSVGSSGIAWSAAATSLRSSRSALTSTDPIAASRITAPAPPDRDPLAAYVQNGSHLAMWMSSTGQSGASNSAAALGLPMTTYGAPDFAAIVAAGGKVTGAIPPDGGACVVYCGDRGTTTYYAAEVDRGDGSPPFFVKGGDMSGSASSDSLIASVGIKDRTDQLKAFLDYISALPNSLAAARRQSIGGRLDWLTGRPATFIDVQASDLLK